MNPDVEEPRRQALALLEATRGETRSALSGVDPGRVVHHDQAGWRVRDVLGHVGVWNGEAARSLRAHAGGGEYHCIESEALYDEYNGLASGERRAWAIEQVWAEYEASADQLRLLVESMPADKWHSQMLYPWNERGTVRGLVEIMMKHEVEHREIIVTG
jgi:hypothetical protein